MQNSGEPVNKSKKEWVSKAIIILLLIYIVFFIFMLNVYEPPGSYSLNLYDVEDNTARQGIIVNLTEEDFKEHPVLAEMIKGEQNIERLFRRDGVIPDHNEADIIREQFIWNPTSGQKHVEYEGKYYEISLWVS